MESHYTVPAIDQVPDLAEDAPTEGPLLEDKLGPLLLPELVFGAGSFSNSYNEDSHLESDVPLRTIRLALRYGIRAFDTSVYYGPSEIVLGNALKALRGEFPRESYRLMTKCGRFGPLNFDYSPAAVRTSVLRSINRLHTTYLDTVYLHDVEFVAEAVGLETKSVNGVGYHACALEDQANAYGLAPGDAAKIWGPGDQKILEAIGELRKLKEEGLVKNIGITGYPLPTLLRLSLLVLHTAPFQPLDVVLSYSHLNMQNVTLLRYRPAFIERAKIKQVLAASPLSMGLLTSNSPLWHPASPALQAVVGKALESKWEGGLPNLAIGYAMQNTGLVNDMPLVVGFSQLSEVHESVKIWRESKGAAGNAAERLKEEESILTMFKESGLLDHSWPSPSVSNT